MKKVIRLSNEFLAKYDDFPSHMTPIGKFTYLRTYSRYLPELKRRETWKETCQRAVEYNINLAYKHMKKLGYKFDRKELEREAEMFFNSMYNLRQFLSGRTLWVGGSENGVADKYPLANFNCSFTNIEKWEDLCDLFYLLLVGTGVGFKCTKEMAANLPPVRDNFIVTHKEYEDLYSQGVRQAETVVVPSSKPNKVSIYVGDSKEGWVDSLRQFFKYITDKKHQEITEIEFVYDFVRPKGARLKTFGGTASGHEPLKEMFTNFEKVIKNQIDPSLEPPQRLQDNYVQLRPIHILDFGNLIGNNVVVGGVRRTAEIFLFDADDFESMFAKYGINGIWDEEKHKAVITELKKLGLLKQVQFLESLPLFDPMARPLHHRRMSNNSVAFMQKPERSLLHLIFTMMRAEGEPGFINLETANKRRPNAEGLNPCAEILLDKYGVCNLTTTNVKAFVKKVNGKYELDLEGLVNAQRLSARAGLRMTLVKLELPHWNKVQQRDRLLGVSLTGWKDAMALLGYSEKEEKGLLALLRTVARDEADLYAKALRVNSPLLVTTVKPEGTLSLVAGAVSSGLHYAHSKYYIRRIRVNADDPLAKAVLEHKGWAVHAEVGTDNLIDEEELAKPEIIEKAKTLVIDFPVFSGTKITKDDISIDQQFDNYFAFQNVYTEHNSSNTITVKPNEWERAEERVWFGWDSFVGVSFLAHDGGSYTLAPYEAIDKERYKKLKAKMEDFNFDLLQKYEIGRDVDLIDESDCVGGVCPVR
ncbi:ribonucleoside-triphosphate reductase, adenosylcobalamin-dependent [Weizmannia sp. CD-2023]|uniref:ribonucleoside-triphosphate reductase, adenosylcobalamin-dependent n=1 Tax=Heyndrickxia TaxID=2837504 RepID=UPI002E1C323B|nr:ribonucleoside-triphosphate reductase, adenosylcobalamin-dependent [Weizmannia sp. CD-2023]MED4841551.1 ribonucleoside-triphosphate reductase, adenosylcobalamin-dependent [Weizmannia sp. CD-2023]MED4899778.1 ribonucleoside-triphosphate reductase, adenosylcobalamin-dependent [Weizmannia sp. CD-2023]